MAALLNGWIEGEPGLEELGRTLRDLAGRRGRLLSAKRLKRGVYRIAITPGQRRLEVVAKRLVPPVAHRIQLALEQWLPAGGVEDAAPRLLGVAAERAGGVVWHLYEDLGSSTLKGALVSQPEVEAAIRLIANLHASFAGAPLLAECRMWGVDHGMAFYDQSVRDALAAVRDALAVAGADSRDNAAAGALLDRLERLDAERDQRARVLAEVGGPDTLLHGDLWLTNVAVLRGSGRRDSFPRHGPTVRLLDWDDVGPGSFSYDLSRIMLRFPARDRTKIVELYRAAVADTSIDVPGDADLDVLFTTAEYARIANEAMWTALAVARERRRWAFEHLAEINRWFERIELLPAA